MPKKARKNKSANCLCLLLRDPLKYCEWSQEECPFIPSRRYKKSKEHEYEILQILECSCGKQVGEKIFSSDRLIGFWRSNNHKTLCDYLKRMSNSFDKKMGQVLEKNLHLLTSLQKQNKELIAKNFAEITLAEEESNHSRSARRRGNPSPYK